MSRAELEQLLPGIYDFGSWGNIRRVPTVALIGRLKAIHGLLASCRATLLPAAELTKALRIVTLFCPADVEIGRCDTRSGNRCPCYMKLTDDTNCLLRALRPDRESRLSGWVDCTTIIDRLAHVIQLFKEWKP